MKKALRRLIRIEIFKLRRKHHKMRNDFMNNDNATESDAATVMIRDIKIRSKIASLKEILHSDAKWIPQLYELYDIPYKSKV